MTSGADTNDLLTPQFSAAFTARVAEVTMDNLRVWRARGELDFEKPSKGYVKHSVVDIATIRFQKIMKEQGKIQAQHVAEIGHNIHEALEQIATEVDPEITARTSRLAGVKWPGWVFFTTDGFLVSRTKPGEPIDFESVASEMNGPWFNAFDAGGFLQFTWETVRGTVSREEAHKQAAGNAG